MRPLDQNCIPQNKLCTYSKHTCFETLNTYFKLKYRMATLLKYGTSYYYTLNARLVETETSLSVWYTYQKLLLVSMFHCLSDITRITNIPQHKWFNVNSYIIRTLQSQSDYTILYFTTSISLYFSSPFCTFLIFIPAFITICRH